MLIGKNNKKVLKKALCLIFALIFSIDGFAAVVADNDGSAFITKAEFDSLKNNFQTQLDSYNSSIDSKIDSAIAAYLAGVKVETTEELDSYLNRINALAEDFYLDGGGNKVKYGYRCMARRYNVKNTQKPIGAITNFLIVRMNTTMDAPNLDDRTRMLSIARVSMNYYNRTAIGDVHVPKNDYQIGKYMMLKKRSDGTYYPYNQYDDITYRYFVGGQSYTYERLVQFSPTNVDDPFTFYNDNGVWTTDTMKNEDKFWGLKIATAKWVWEQQETQVYNYDNMRTVYGGSFEYQEHDEVFPLVSDTSSNVYALDYDRLPEMSLEGTARDRIMRLDRGLWIYQATNMDKAYSTWHAPPSAEIGDDNGPDGEYNADDPNGGTVHWTFYFNHHPWQTINTRDLVDNNISQTLGKSVKLTSGIPVCKATMDGTVDIKMKFMGDPTHSYACGWQKNEFTPNSSSPCQIDSSLNLRDFDDTKITDSVVTVDNELNFRMDVKKGDVIWIRAVDTTNQYGFVGAKTISIKNIKKD